MFRPVSLRKWPSLSISMWSFWCLFLPPTTCIENLTSKKINVGYFQCMCPWPKITTVKLVRRAFEIDVRCHSQSESYFFNCYAQRFNFGKPQEWWKSNPGQQSWEHKHDLCAVNERRKMELRIFTLGLLTIRHLTFAHFTLRYFYDFSCRIKKERKLYFDMFGSMLEIFT